VFLKGGFFMSSKKIFLKLFKFIFGALLLFIALFPVYWLIVMAVQPSEALSDPKLLPHSLTVMNFIELFTEKNFGRALSNSLLITLKFSVFSVLFEVLLGFVMALFVQSLTKKTARLMRISLLIPYLLPSVTVALSFRMMLSPNYGIINKALEGLGITAPNWFSDMRTALPMLILIDIWQNAPFVFLLLYAAMQAIPKSQYEAAKIDGASYPALVRYVTIPGILPVLALSALLRTIDSFRIFDKVNLLTGGGPANSTTTITQYLYTYGIKNLKFGFGSAGAIIMTILVLLLSVAYIKKAVE
jgi:ABC-type sugar transport system permease subunit